MKIRKPEHSLFSGVAQLNLELVRKDFLSSNPVLYPLLCPTRSSSSQAHAYEVCQADNEAPKPPQGHKPHGDSFCHLLQPIN